MKRSFGYITAIGLAAATAGLTLTASMAQAQTIFRIVGPDGRVTFSDKQPEANGKAAVQGSARPGGTPATDGLPFELRQISTRFPVTLYTGDNCAPCDSGRALLSGRGIPFAERTITTQQDVEALQRLSGQNSLPFLTIGGQKIRGFLASEWVQYLDAAGYPQSSQLPAGYRNPPAAPLVALPKPIPAEGKPSETALPTEQPQPPAANPSNPAGIVF